MGLTGDLEPGELEEKKGRARNLTEIIYQGPERSEKWRKSGKKVKEAGE